MVQTFTPARRPFLRLFLASRFFLPLIILAGLALGFGVIAVMDAIQNTPRPVAQIHAAAMEERFGIRFTLIALTADNGLVDIRYVVTEPVKAMNMEMDEGNLPVIVTRNGDKVSTSMAMIHRMALETGRQYWMIYYNTHNAIKTGDVVTLSVGDFRIPNVLVQ